MPVKKIDYVNIIGAGLAGCEAALFLAGAGIPVNLYDMKPGAMTPAHSNQDFCELVCSNSLKGTKLSTAGGLLKEELQMLGSQVLQAAYGVRVPAGGALAVDRGLFAASVTKSIKSNQSIRVFSKEVEEIDATVPTIIATGPLTAGRLYESVRSLCGDDKAMFFFDASAPIVTADSIDYTSAYEMNRYQSGTPDYLNCPMTEEEYRTFYDALVSAETVALKGFEGKEVFEGCMPVEVLAKRGYEAIRYGMLKPVGLSEKPGKRPYAVLQLRAENNERTMYNLVGFQTNLKFSEQKRVFSLIPALKGAEFVRYGVMHRNSYIDAPGVLLPTFMLREHPGIFIAGQLSGVEGYVESIMSGLLSAVNMLAYLNGSEPVVPSALTMSGAICRRITEQSDNFQPVGASFGLLPPLAERIKDKLVRYEALSARAVRAFAEASDAVRKLLTNKRADM